jgi:hypothetical protein
MSSRGSHTERGAYRLAEKKWATRCQDAEVVFQEMQHRTTFYDTIVRWQINLRRSLEQNTQMGAI